MIPNNFIYNGNFESYVVLRKGNRLLKFEKVMFLFNDREFPRNFTNFLLLHRKILPKLPRKIVSPDRGALGLSLLSLLGSPAQIKWNIEHKFLFFKDVEIHRVLRFERSRIENSEPVVAL